MTRTVLITGANRGIGLALARLYAARGDRVVAAVRDPARMPAVDGAIVVRYDAGDDKSALQAVDEIKAHGIDSLDIIIANAGVNMTKDVFATVPVDDLLATWRINVLAPILLFQATFALAANAKFAVISSEAGTINQDFAPGQGAYGQSKAAVNYFAHFENPGRVIFSIHPGWVSTEMGEKGASWSGMDKVPLDIDTCCRSTTAGIVKVLDEATRENYSGYMINWDGSRALF